MKRVLIWLAGFFLVVLVALALAPFLFKDQIKQKLDAQIASNINATVYYDASSLGLSFFSHFPHLTVSLERFGIVGQGVFAGDTLANIGRFSTTINLASLLAGSKLQITALELDAPTIRALRLPNGQANWDIIKPDSSAPEKAPKEPAQFALQINKWTVTKGEISFIDAQMPLVLAIHGLQHTGSGDFTQDVLDLATETEAQKVSVRMDSVTYLTDKHLRLKMAANIDQKAQKYTLKENELYVNELGIALDGWVQMVGQAIQTDMKFKSLNGTFKDVLSLVPGMYTKSFAGIKADGNFNLDGIVQGTYQGTNLPRLRLKFAVQDGQFQYPNLPSAVTGIGIDVDIDHPQGPLKATAIHLKKFDFKMGNNPFVARADIAGLEDMLIDGYLKAKLNLTEISRAFPMQGLTMRGLLSVDATAKGVYSAARKRLPAVSGSLNLLDGYVKSAQLPAPIEALTVQAFVENATGRMEDTHIRIPAMSFSLEGQPFTASAQIDDLVNYRWDVALRGKLDLAKITKIYPIEGTTVAGLLTADIKTRGAMADVKAKRYDRLPTSGTLDLVGLVYKAKDLAQPITASAVSMRFTPAQIQLTRFDGAAGKSAMHLQGSLQNYFGYFLSGQTLAGNLQLTSPDFDLNPWLAAEPVPAGQPVPAAQALVLPRNLNITMQATFGKLLYTNMDMRQVAGRILVSDGVATLSNLRMQTLGGDVLMDGTYDSRPADNPSYDMSLDMKNVAIAEVYTTFNTLQALAPVAKSITGRMSAKLRLAGKLNGKMEPILSTLYGGGNADIIDAQVRDLKAIQGLNQLTKLNLPTEAALRNLKVAGQIMSGRLNFKPFDVNIGGQKLTFGGSNGLDQSIDWTMNTLLPAGAVSKAASALPALANVQGLNQALPINFKVTGTHTSPKVSFASMGTSSVSGAIKERANQEADKLKQQVEQRAKDEVDRLRKENEDRLKQEATDKAKEELEKLKNKFKL